MWLPSPVIAYRVVGTASTVQQGTDVGPGPLAHAGDQDKVRPLRQSDQPALSVTGRLAMRGYTHGAG